MKIGKTEWCGQTNTGIQYLISALSEGEISAVPSKTKPDNVLYAKMQKQAVMKTQLFFLIYKAILFGKRELISHTAQIILTLTRAVLLE